MEELADGFIKAAARGVLTLLKVIIWLAWELLCERFLWYLGWPVLRTITFGRFPAEELSQAEHASTVRMAIVALVGLAWPLAGAYFLALYVGS